MEIFEHFKTKTDDKNFLSYQKLSAIIASLLLSISPIFLGISVYGKSHAPCMFFMIIGILKLLQYLRTNEKKYFFYSAIFLGLMGASRIVDLVLIAIPLSFLFVSMHRNPLRSDSYNPVFHIIKTFFFWWGSIGLFTLLFYLPLFIQEKPGSFLSGLNECLDIALFNSFLGFFSPHLLKTFNYLVKNFTYPGIFLSLAGLFSLSKENAKILIFLLLWIVCPTLYYGNLYLTMTSRYFVVILPPIIFAMAYVLANFKNKKLFFKSIAFILFWGISLTTFFRIYPLLKIRHQYDDVPAFTKWFKKIAEPNSRMIHGDGSAFFHYYGNVTLAPRPLSSKRIDKEELEKFKINTNALIKGGIPVYINSVGLFSYNCRGNFSNFVYKNYDLEYIGSHYYEDWHGGAMEDRRINLNVYKLSIKEENDETQE